MDTLYSHSYPHFTEALNYTLEKIDANKIAQHSDYVFLATPAGISTKITPELVAGGQRLLIYLVIFGFTTHDCMKNGIKIHLLQKSG
ncbi:MAG: hypothetical protein LRY37_03240 [Alkalibacterium thalassium]|nr:hypothetical protein [Alkalibacterium thalassium]